MVAQNNSTGVGRAQDWGTHHMDNEIGILYGASTVPVLPSLPVLA